MAFPSSRKALAGVIIAAAALGVAGCQATVNKRGYLPDPRLQSIRIGVDTKASLSTALGSPSTMGTFNDNTWYYISTTQEDQYFFKPQETERQVVAVSFGADQVVTGVRQYGPNEAVQVAFNDRETPARGRELTFLQQIFGNVGRGSPVGTLGREEDPRDRR